MSTVQTVIVGRIATVGQRARLVCAGVGTLELPWWPTTMDYANLAPRSTDIDRPGRTPLVKRSYEPLDTLTIEFLLRGTSLEESADPWIDLVRRLAVAKPLSRLILGTSDRGMWRVTDAGYRETEQTSAGDPAAAEVSLQLRRESASGITVGPVAPKSKKAGK